MAAASVVTGPTVSVSTSSVAGLPQPAAATHKARNTNVRELNIMGWVPQSRARGRSAHSEDPMPFARTATAFAVIAAAPAEAPRCPSGPGDTNPQPFAPLPGPAE